MALTQAATTSKTSLQHPASICELMSLAYAARGRRLNVAQKDLYELRRNRNEADAELELVRHLASSDPLLNVPPTVLSMLVDVRMDADAEQRVLDLLLVALSGHRLFQNRLSRLADFTLQPELTPRELSNAARALADADNNTKASDAARERLRTNGITILLLFRLLRREWPIERFVDEMSTYVWRVAAKDDPRRLGATLASARNIEALGSLTEHFQTMLRTSRRIAADAQSQAYHQGRRAELAAEKILSMTGELESQRARVAQLVARTEDLSELLTRERSNRVEDRSHFVDDYEVLRTRVIRRLTGQIEVLSDGLHALRHGSPKVTEEYLDRALDTFRQEVERLKTVDRERQ